MIGIEPSLCREIGASRRKDAYQWSNDDFPPHLKEIPDSDNVPAEEIFDAMGLLQTINLINKLIPNGEVSDEKLEILGIEGKPYSGASISKIEENNRSNELWRNKRGTDIKKGLNIGDLPDWYSDSRFAQQQFTGTNPNTIKSASKTWISEFSKEAEKQGSKKVQELFQRSKDSSFYIQDGSYFRDAIGVKGDHVMESNGRFLCATVSLFQLHSDGRLHPVAIVIDFKGSFDKSVTIFNKRLHPSDSSIDEERTDWPWRYAKTCAQVADWIRHEVTVHLVNTHFIEEVIIVATNRNMDSKHPVFRLLEPHWLKTLSLNAAARASLIPNVILELVGLENAETFKFIGHAFKEFDFVAQYVPNDLASRGFPTEKLDEGGRFKNYAYGRNMKQMWDVLRTFVASMLAIHYKSDAAVASDQQIKEWYKEIQSQEGGQLPSFPTITTRDHLIDAVTMCIHIASPQHTAVNYLQNFYMAFVIAKPSALFHPPPLSLSKLSSYTEHDLVKALPINRQREWLLSAQLPWLLSFRVAEENNLLSYASSLWNLYRQKSKPDEKKTAEIARTFYNKLRDLISVFQDHSDQMTKTTIPYTVMDPNDTAISILI